MASEMEAPGVFRWPEIRLNFLKNMKNSGRLGWLAIR